jgi:glycogen debranching enzyme
VKNEHATVNGSTFVVSDALGDILRGTEHGFFHADTRFLSALTITVNGVRPVALSSYSNGAHAAVFHTTNPALASIPAETLLLVRARDVTDQLCESLTVTNYGADAVELCIAFDCAADFADIFEVRGLASIGRDARAKSDPGHSIVRFQSRVGGLLFSTVVRATNQPRIDSGRIDYSFRLGSHQSWATELVVGPRPPALTESGPPRERRLSREMSAPTNARRPSTLKSDFIPLTTAFDRSVQDLEALRVALPDGSRVPAAGLPWYMAIFGRDSLITGLQTLALDADFARGALASLAQHQSHHDDPFRDAEPGKIAHEIRQGRLSRLERVPHGRYFGTVDATPLFLVTLGETVRWTGDLALGRGLLPAAEEALTWIDRWGDLDGDGFVEYHKRSPQGLDNQGWKDSHDAIAFANGQPATGPIALCEVQGYVYWAKRAMAWLFGELEMPDRAAELRAEADRLRISFNQHFWLPEQQTFAVALDGEKRPVDAVTSNAGQCLWTGIADHGRATAVARRLFADDLFSGWGIRTLAAGMAAYNPLSYHNGSVWPHDNALIAAGLARYGFSREASRLIRAQLDATHHFERSRAPELFAGVPRHADEPPVPYPHANAPQAWAAGGVIMMAQTWLGASITLGQPYARPLPGAPRIDWHGFAFGENRYDIVAPRKGPVRLTPSDEPSTRIA